LGNLGINKIRKPMAAAEALSERLVCLAAAFFQRIAAHRGRKRAIVAVSHALLVVCYHLLQHKCHFQDLGVNYFDHPNREKLIRYFVKRLTRLGHKMTIEPCEASA